MPATSAASTVDGRPNVQRPATFPFSTSRFIGTHGPVPPHAPQACGQFISRSAPARAIDRPGSRIISATVTLCDPVSVGRGLRAVVPSLLSRLMREISACGNTPFLFLQRLIYAPLLNTLRVYSLLHIFIRLTFSSRLVFCCLCCRNFDPLGPCARAIKVNTLGGRGSFPPDRPICEPPLRNTSRYPCYWNRQCAHLQLFFCDGNLKSHIQFI